MRSMRSRVAAWLVAGALFSPCAAFAADVKFLVQRSPLAGFRHHEAASLWNDMKVGDVLSLAREPSNPHDANAVRVEWRGHMLGYVPRSQNQALAWAMDRGEPVTARIAAMRIAGNSRRVLEFEVFID
jgi:HIRAN domain